jgi:hypothetical protein
MRYKVPQNIDMQDRIIGPLTMLQFMYAVIGGGFCYGIIMSGIPKILAYLIAIPIGLFVAAMIFLKINERPFLDFFLSVIEYSSTPKQRLWHHENSADLNVEVYKPKIDNKTPAVVAKNYSRQDIQKLAKEIDPQQK